MGETIKIELSKSLTVGEVFGPIEPIPTGPAFPGSGGVESLEPEASDVVPDWPLEWPKRKRSGLDVDLRLRSGFYTDHNPATVLQNLVNGESWGENHPPATDWFSAEGSLRLWKPFSSSPVEHLGVDTMNPLKFPGFSISLLGIQFVEDRWRFNFFPSWEPPSHYQAMRIVESRSDISGETYPLGVHSPACVPPLCWELSVEGDDE